MARALSGSKLRRFFNLMSSTGGPSLEECGLETRRLEQEEVLLLIKTSRTLFGELRDEIERLHS